MTSVSNPSPDAVSADAAARSAADDEQNERTFSTSIVVSGVRCLLAYIVFPWLLPALGVAQGVGPAVGIVIGLVAIGFNVYSIQKFWTSEHRWRNAVIALNAVIIVLLTVMLVLDLVELA